MVSRAALRARRRQYEARAFIEDQLAAAERLKESEEGRRLAIEAAQIGTWHYFPATGRLDAYLGNGQSGLMLIARRNFGSWTRTGSSPRMPSWGLPSLPIWHR